MIIFKEQKNGTYNVVIDGDVCYTVEPTSNDYGYTLFTRLHHANLGTFEILLDIRTYLEEMDK